MKKSIFTTAILFGLLTFSTTLKAQNQDLSVMKDKAEVLELTTDLAEKNIDLEKERQENVKISSTVESLNNKSDNRTDDFSISDPKSTAKDAKKTAKTLKKTESANRDLERSNNKIIDLEGDVKKLEMKLEKLKYTVEIKEK